MDFSKIAPNLANPLVLIGFVLFLFFGFCRKTLPEEQVKYGFILAILVVTLGFGLNYLELAMTKQQSSKSVAVSHKSITTPSKQSARYLSSDTIRLKNSAIKTEEAAQTSRQRSVPHPTSSFFQGAQFISPKQVIGTQTIQRNAYFND